MYKRVFFQALCLSLLLFSACLAEAKKPRIGVFIFKVSDIYINSVKQALEKHLSPHADVTIFDANNNQTIQSEQLYDYLATNPDAVAVNLVDIKVSQSILNMVKRKNIPLIFFNKEPSLEIIKTYSKARYVGTDAKQCSVIQGEIIANLWKENPQFDRNKDGVCNFLMLQGGLDNPEALRRTKVSIQEARKHHINMQQVGDTLICDWDAACAYDTTQLAFKLYKNDIDFIIANNDDMAMGAIKTLQELGFNTKGGTFIPVVGVDAVEKAKKAIAEGIMHGTVLQDADAMAMTISTMLLNSVANKPYLQGLPYGYDDSGIAVRIPYRAYDVHNALGH